MLSFFSRNKRALFLVALLAATLTLFARDIRSKRPASFFDRLLLTLADPPLRLTARAVDGVDTLWQRYIGLVHTQRENAVLRRRLDELLLQQELLQEQARENQRLRDMLGFRQRVPHRMVPAEIIGRDPTSWFKTIMVDKGSRDGVNRGDGVITPDGVVGRIIQTGHANAQVLLLLDVNSNIDAMVQRSQARGIATGTGSDRCLFNYVLKTEDVAEGDRVLTSGWAGSFPRGLPLGTVVGRRDTSGFFQTIEVHPAVDVSKLQEVFIILGESDPP